MTNDPVRRTLIEWMFSVNVVLCGRPDVAMTDKERLIDTLQRFSDATGIPLIVSCGPSAQLPEPSSHAANPPSCSPTP